MVPVTRTLRGWGIAFVVVAACVLIAGCGASSHVSVKPFAPPPAGMSLQKREFYYLRLVAKRVRASGECPNRRNTIARQPRSPAVATGRLDPRLLMVLAVLDRPHTSADAVPRSIRGNPPSERFVNNIRLARSLSGTAFYIVPSASASGLRLPFAPCFGTIVRQVRHDAPRIPKAIRAGALALLDKVQREQRRISHRRTG